LVDVLHSCVLIQQGFSDLFASRQTILKESKVSSAECK